MKVKPRLIINSNTVLSVVPAVKQPKKKDTVMEYRNEEFWWIRMIISIDGRGGGIEWVSPNIFLVYLSVFQERFFPSKVKVDFFFILDNIVVFLETANDDKKTGRTSFKFISP